jgi:CRP-like cAMP-binding protein
MQINQGAERVASAELARKLASAGETRRVAGGARLFSCGEASQGVFLVMKGRARATLPSTAGRKLMCRTAEPGAVLGLPSALCETHYQFDVEALEPLEAVFVETAAVNEILRLHPELCLRVMQLLCNELSDLGETREHMRNCTNEKCALHGTCSAME